jgi:hypothetical protein
MINKLITFLILITAVTAGVFLFFREEAAKPGNLGSPHAQFSSCTMCHEPWQGVDSSSCQQCHFFSEVKTMAPSIRFHIAGEHCLKCHTEHQGRKGPVSAMDHTLLNPELSCTRCHFDPHSGLFGPDCRECHGLRTWQVKGFQHPSQDQKTCNRCHKPPDSHRFKEFQQRILEGHDQVFPEDESPMIENCWRCHLTKDWRPMLMEHEL